MNDYIIFLMAVNLQTLAKEIDADFAHIKTTPFKRISISYAVFIDEIQTDIIARKTSRIAYLINTKQNRNSFTRFYIEDWQIGIILARLDEGSFSILKNWLVAVYFGKHVEEHKLKFFRPVMHRDLGEKGFESMVNMIYLSDIKSLPPEIDTTFGFSVSSRSFIDFLCLSLSMEDKYKLDIELTKHCMFADLLKNKNVSMIHELVPQIAGVETAYDVEKLYDDMITQVQAEDYDRMLFSKSVTDEYFGALASKL